MKSVKQMLSAKGAQIYSVRPDSKVIDALRLMAEKNVGALVVLESTRLIGIFSERDYARKAILHGKSSGEITVREIMTSDVVTIEPERTVEECMALVTSHRIRHLPVVENDRLLGVISIGDLVKAVIAEQELTIRQLESYIHS